MSFPKEIKVVTIVTAKLLILGDSGVGKSGLLHRLEGDVFAPMSSTHGAKVSHISVPHKKLLSHPTKNLIGELELWDLAGQPDYNVIHQIFLQGANAALIVIDETSEEPLEPLRYWIEFLQKHSPEVQTKLLVSARIDRGGPLLEDTEIQERAKTFGFSGFFRTSAKTGDGISSLREGIFNSIDWSKMIRIVRPASWQQVHQFIRREAKTGTVLLPFEIIKHQFDDDKLTKEEINTILMQMHRTGVVFVLNPRKDAEYVLFNPDILNSYGSSIVLSARSNVNGPGEIEEASVLRADIDLRGVERLSVLEERIILDSVVSLLVKSGACYRESGKLIFPSQLRSRAIKCFLSHNSADKPIAEELGRRLLDKGIDVWLDKWEILAGESITSKIEEGIDNATAFIILMSRNSMKAKWVREELRIAIQRRLERPEFSLIPILLEDCDRPGFLRDYVYVDWRSPTEETFEYLLNSLRGIKMKPTRRL